MEQWIGTQRMHYGFIGLEKMMKSNLLTRKPPIPMTMMKLPQSLGARLMSSTLRHLHAKLLRSLIILYKSIQMSLLKILGDSRLMTNIRMIGFTNGTKMCHEYRKSHGWMLEHEKNPHMLNIIASLFNYKIGNSLHYQDLEWYEALEDGELKEEALKNKAIMEGIIKEDYESSNKGWRRWDGYEITNRNHEEREFKMKHNNEGRCELFDDHELSVCNIRKFEMIKWSFGDDEKYVAIKEDEYDDLTSTSKYACRVYQEIFHMMDYGWMVTRDE
nr:hypothetical protein [Tanacetum cinerariifolium]